MVLLSCTLWTNPMPPTVLLGPWTAPEGRGPSGGLSFLLFHHGKPSFPWITLSTVCSLEAEPGIRILVQINYCESILPENLGSSSGSRIGQGEKITKIVISREPWSREELWSRNCTPGLTPSKGKGTGCQSWPQESARPVGWLTGGETLRQLWSAQGNPQPKAIPRKRKQISSKGIGWDTDSICHIPADHQRQSFKGYHLSR